MPEQFKPYNLDQAQNEAEKMSSSAEVPADKQAKVENGEAKDYKEAEEKVEQEEKKLDLEKSKNPEAFDSPKLGYEKFRSALAKTLFEAKDKELRQQILKKEKNDTNYDKSREFRKLEKSFVVNLKKANRENEVINNLKSLEKAKRYLAYLDNVVTSKDIHSSFSTGYINLLNSIRCIKRDHPVLYTAFVENKINILDFRHTAFQNITGGLPEIKLKEDEADNKKIRKTLSQSCWEPLFVCSAPSWTWLDKEPQKNPVIFFDNKKVLEKAFENYDTDNISQFIDEEIIEERLPSAHISLDSGGAHAAEVFEYHARQVSRNWKLLYNSYFLVGSEATEGTVTVRLHSNKNGKIQKYFFKENFNKRLKEMTDKKMSLDEIQEQIDKEFMYRSDENTTISPLIMDNSFIRAVYLNGKIYNNKGEVIVDEKEEVLAQEKT